jgi:hypothetical protein
MRSELIVISESEGAPRPSPMNVEARTTATWPDGRKATTASHEDDLDIVASEPVTPRRPLLVRRDRGHEPRKDQD